MNRPVVARHFHLARAAIFTQVARFGKNIVALFGFWMGQRFVVLGLQRMNCLHKNRRGRRGREFVGGCFHKFISPLGNGLRRTTAICLCLSLIHISPATQSPTRRTPRRRKARPCGPRTPRSGLWFHPMSFPQSKSDARAHGNSKITKSAAPAKIGAASET